MNFNTGTREYIESIFNGQTPVERENPLKGQSKYFYFKPGQRDDISVSDMETVDVPTADTPNPFLNVASTNPCPSPIQNEIYNKDRSTYSQPYGNTPPPAMQRNAQLSRSVVNNYLIPEEAYTAPNWGQQTAAKLDEYMQNYNSYPGKTRTGILAPFHDMWRNYKTMTEDQKWVGGDNFFHCKANYEAAKRGPWGKIISKAISTGREIYGIAKGEPLSDVRKDWHANSMGWNGAKQGLSLEESCPTNPKAYVNPDDYNDIF